MIKVTQHELMPGVRLTAVHTNKFKSSYLGAAFLTPMAQETAAANALIPWVLRRGSRSYPNLQAISQALDEMYGGSIEPLITKKGETQCVGFVASFLDDAYTLKGEAILESAAQMLGELLLHPSASEEGFRPEYVNSERQNLVDRIRAQMNDKRQYSMLRLGQEMCPYEAYGVNKLGDEESAGRITCGSLWERYETLLATAQVELFYCGCVAAERVERALRQAFADLPVNAQRQGLNCDVRITAPVEPNVVEESLDVTQGKLAIGFRTGGISVWEEEFPALLLLNAVYGGTSMSKLFMNVREKLSLCYFASSQLERMKGLMMVSSGIEFDKYRQARDEILAQLEACRRGDITDDELEGARRIVITALRTTLDSQSRLADYWLGQAAAELTETPEELVARLEQVTREQVVHTAQQLQLDTIYFLKGKEAEQ